MQVKGALVAEEGVETEVSLHDRQLGENEPQPVAAPEPQPEAEYVHQDTAERVAVTFYGIVLLLSSTMLLVLWRYAVRARLVRPDTADEEIELLTERLTPDLGAYLVLIVSGLFVPIIAVIGFLGIALYYIIPFRRLSAGFLPRRWRKKQHRR